MCGCMDIWLKLVHQSINPSINVRKITKLYIDVCECECGYANVNVADSVSANDNDNVVGCVYEKIFYTY